MTMAKLPLLRWVLTAVAICATGMLGMALPQFGASMTLPILPSGIAVAAYYRWGRRMWPAIAVGTLAIDLGRAPGPLMAICVAIGLLAGCEVFQRILDRQDFEPRFTRARDVPVYVAAACCGMAFAATFGLLGHFLGREDRPFLNDSMALSWLSW